MGTVRIGLSSPWEDATTDRSRRHSPGAMGFLRLGDPFEDDRPALVTVA